MIQAGTIRMGSGRTSASERLILNEFHQPVAKHDLARRGRNVFPDLELLGSNRRPAVDDPLPVLDEVPEAAHQVLAGFGLRSFQDLGIGQQEVGGCEDVEKLSASKLQCPLVFGRYAADSCRRIVPPLLLQKETLVDDVERPLVPVGGAEALVLR